MAEITPTSLHLHRWTRDQYEQMVEAGVLTPEDRVELLDGQIVTMSPQNSRHATVVTLCRDALHTTCSGDYHLRTQAPLALGRHTEPESDIALVPGNASSYWEQHPSQADLVVEVADSSLEKDRDQKRRVYAQHSVPEYWIINLRSRHVEVYRSPSEDEYATKATARQGDQIAPQVASCSPLSVSQLIPE